MDITDANPTYQWSAAEMISNAPDLDTFLTALKLNGFEFWGKTGDRPGYNNGMAATKDLTRRAVFSVNTLHMGGAEQPLITQKIIGAVAGLG